MAAAKLYLFLCESHLPLCGLPRPCLRPTTVGASTEATRPARAIRRLKQITRENVAKLRPAWTYHTGALKPETELNEKAAFEATPILVEGTLYLSTPFNRVIALDPASGAEKWTYDPKVDRSHDYSEVTSRGVASWSDSKAAAGAPCKLRIFEGTIDARLIALDGKTGKPCADFGAGGTVNLTRGVVYGPEFRGNYQVTSAPTVVGDLVITGSSIADNGAVDMPRGVVRAYDARTGALRWTWDPIPWAEKQQVRTGAANAWSTFAADPARDMVFIPTGSASPDYYGGTRPGDNKWANSVVALKASTGAFVWGFQVAHHDLWDYDVASQPALIEFRGKPAVAVTTKIGHVFVLDRTHRQAAAHGGGARRSEERHPRRGCVAQPADSGLERDGAAKTDRGRCVGRHSRSAPVVPPENRCRCATTASSRRPVCAAPFRSPATSAA